MTRSIRLIPCLLAAAALCLLAPGCSSAPTAAYKAEQSAAITVDAAMSAWGDYVAAQHPPVSQELAVRAAFQKYQAAQLLAIDATKLFADALAANTNNVTAAQPAQAAVANAMTQAAAALSDLVGLIQSFGVKIQ